MLLASYYYHYHPPPLLLLLLAMDMDMEKTTAGASEDSEEKMITLELEAAEALAGLAYSATPHQQPESPPVINYGSSSFPPQKPSQPPSTCDLPPHLPQGQAIVIKEPSERVSNVITRTVKDEKNDEFKAGGLSCSTSYFSVGGSSSRQPSTEIEKETRRLRRVLANRESARQTIRRRQAIFEELTRKAANLTLENENLKKKKELAMKEYDSLKNTNDYLMEQMAKMVKPKSEQITGESNFNCGGCSVSACSRTPFSPYTPSPILPLHWPSAVQPLDATLFRSRSLCDIANPSLFAMTHEPRPELLSDQRESAMVANPGALLYVLPFPCFFPLHSPTNALRRQPSPQNDGQNQAYSNNQCAASSSAKNSLHGEDDQACLSLKVKTEASNSTVNSSVDDVHQAGFGYPPDGGGNIGGTYPDRMVLMPTPLRCVRPATSLPVGLSTAARRNDTLTKAEVAASSAGQREKGASEEYQKPVVYSRKMSEDATTAAEARRRRKELMKLKIL
ncbi:uncharacterized protein [Coffea arabica]|uniref:Uncharacterized protein isoform X2 n=1 Tax=Coffea arabica TaxID=13443 RepID=A0ABM4VJK7_COFAR